MALFLLLIVYAIALAIGLARRGLTSVSKISVVPTGTSCRNVTKSYTVCPCFTER
jgi:hypothetical protein